MHVYTCTYMYKHIKNMCTPARMCTYAHRKHAVVHSVHASKLRHMTNATYCNTLQHTAIHRNVLQYTATHCNILQHTTPHDKHVHSHTQHTPTTMRIQTLQDITRQQHTATRCNNCTKLQRTKISPGETRPARCAGPSCTNLLTYTVMPPVAGSSRSPNFMPTPRISEGGVVACTGPIRGCTRCISMGSIIGAVKAPARGDEKGDSKRCPATIMGGPACLITMSIRIPPNKGRPEEINEGSGADRGPCS